MFIKFDSLKEEEKEKKKKKERVPKLAKKLNKLFT